MHLKLITKPAHSYEFTPSFDVPPPPDWRDNIAAQPEHQDLFDAFADREPEAVAGKAAPAAFRPLRDFAGPRSDGATPLLPPAYAEAQVHRAFADWKAARITARASLAIVVSRADDGVAISMARVA